jgi:spore coat polysaccharide biosynthesis protein SpsF
LLDEAAGQAEQNPWDLVTNLCPRTFPYGVSVELVRTATYEKAYGQFTRPEHFEHVTSYLYEHADQVRLLNLFRRGPNLAHVRLTVDTPADLEALRALAESAREKGSSLHYQEAAVFAQRLGVH